MEITLPAETWKRIISAGLIIAKGEDEIAGRPGIVIGYKKDKTGTNCVYSFATDGATLCYWEKPCYEIMGSQPEEPVIISTKSAKQIINIVNWLIREKRSGELCSIIVIPEDRIKFVFADDLGSIPVYKPKHTSRFPSINQIDNLLSNPMPDKQGAPENTRCLNPVRMIEANQAFMAIIGAKKNNRKKICYYFGGIELVAIVISQEQHNKDTDQKNETAIVMFREMIGY